MLYIYRTTHTAEMTCVDGFLDADGLFTPSRRASREAIPKGMIFQISCTRIGLSIFWTLYAPLATM